MTGSDYRQMTIAARFAKRRFRLIAAPAPSVAKPNRRQQMQRRRFGTAVSCIYPDEDVVGIRLRVLKLDVKVATFSERVRVPNLELAFHFRTPVVRRDQLFVRKTRLRITVNHPHETVRRRAVDVPIKFL